MLEVHITSALSLLFIQAGRILLARSRLWRFVETYGKVALYISGATTLITGLFLLRVAPLAVVCVRGGVFTIVVIGLEFHVNRVLSARRDTASA